MPLEPSLAASAEARLQQLREQIDAALHTLVADLLSQATLDRDAAVVQARSDVEREVQTAVEQARSAAERETRAAVDEARSDSETALSERQCDLACLERLRDAVRDLDAATSLSQVLDKLGEHASGQVARVAILVARAGELRGWKIAGFDLAAADASIITLPLDGRTVAARAASTGQAATTRDAGQEVAFEQLSFAPLPDNRLGLALPLRVGERTVAVVYADEGTAAQPTVPSAWPEALEILARHAGRCLELVTATRAYGLHAQQEPAAPAAPADRPPAPEAERPIEQSVQPSARLPQAIEEDASAQRYARLLISEIKLYHEEAVEEGRRDANLMERLGPEIARARRLYEERIPAEVRGRGDHFGQELIRTLANGDPRLLGQVP